MELKFKTGSSAKLKMNAGDFDAAAVHSATVRNAYTCTQAEYDALKQAGEIDSAGLYFIVEEDE